MMLKLQKRAQKLTKMILIRLVQRPNSAARVAPILPWQEGEDFYQDEVEEFHSKRNEQLLERLKHLEPIVSSDDEEDYTDEVLFLKVSVPHSGYDRCF